MVYLTLHVVYRTKHEFDCSYPSAAVVSLLGNSDSQINTPFWPNNDSEVNYVVTRFITRAIVKLSKSKVGNLSRGWPEGSLFNSYYTEVLGGGDTPFPGLLHFTLDPYLIMLSVWRCPWCNSYCRRKWTWWHEFKSWTLHIALIPLEMVWIQLVSLQLCVNSRTD